MSSDRVFSSVVITLLSGAGLIAAAGCEEPKRKVLDIKAPGVDIEVDKSRSGADVHIDNNAGQSGTRVEVDTPPAGSSPAGPKVEVDTRR